MLTDLKAIAGIAALSLIACTRLNPAFTDTDAAAGETAATGSDTKPDTGDTAADGSTDTSASSAGATDTSSSESSGVDESDSAETGPEPCTVEDNQELRFKIFNEAGIDLCEETLDAYFSVEGPSNNQHILAQPCSEGCETCEDGPGVELEAYPADLTEFATALSGSCLHVQLGKLVHSSATYCEYSKAMMHRVVDLYEERPVFVGSSQDGEVPDPAVPLFEELGLVWEFEGFPCECLDGDPCCLPEDPPTAYDYDFIDGPVLRPGDEHEFPAEGVGVWVFEAWESEYVNSCGAQFEASWMAYLDEGA